MNSIAIKVKKAEGKHDIGASKFFGTPTVPQEWQNKFSDDVIFFCQIRLEDIKEFDTENKLPHKGYLYVFLDVESYPYMPLVYYYDGEPDMALDDFNEVEPRFSHLTKDWLMTFGKAEDCSDGIRLFGVPSSDCGEDKELLMQFDPLEAGMGFLSEIDGYMYLFFGENNKDFDSIEILIDRS